MMEQRKDDGKENPEEMKTIPKKETDKTHSKAEEDSDLRAINEEEEKRRHMIPEQWWQNIEFIDEQVFAILRYGTKPKASSAEILNACRDNPDWIGELYGILDKGLKKFQQVYTKAKWNDDRQLITFMYLLKDVTNNPHRFFYRRFSMPVDDHLQTVTTTSKDFKFSTDSVLQYSLNDREATQVINDILDIMNLGTISAKEARTKVKVVRVNVAKGIIKREAGDQEPEKVAIYYAALSLKKKMQKDHLPLSESRAVEKACEKVFGNDTSYEERHLSSFKWFIRGVSFESESDVDKLLEKTKGLKAFKKLDSSILSRIGSP